MLTTTKPARIQRKRVKGWTKPEGAVYVGRGSRYGNPFRLVREGNLWIVRVDPADGVVGRTVGDYVLERQARQVAVDEFRAMFRGPAGWELAEYFALRLHGRDLMCWCAEDQACHADVLLELAAQVRTAPGAAL
jgi:hypothetical protein